MSRRIARPLVLLTALLGFSGCVYLEDPDPLLKEMKPGDITGVLVGVPPGELSVKPIAGGRVNVRDSALTRVTNAEGRFYVRNLPEGRHVLGMFLDSNNDRIPDLARQLMVPISVPAGRKERTRLNLGKITLLKPGRIVGRVTGDIPDMTQVVVAVERVGLRAQVEADGTFTLAGLGPSIPGEPDTDWKLVAGAPGRVSEPVSVTLGEDETAEVNFQLVQPVGMNLPVVVNVEGNPDVQGVLTQALSNDTMFALSTDGTLVDQAPLTRDPSSQQDSFTVTLPQGLYDLVFLFVDPDVLPASLTVLVSDNADVNHSLRLFRRPTTSGDCVDQDGDGLCALAADGSQGDRLRCAEECMRADSCAVQGRVEDCDDDSDLQPDADEALTCRCAPDPQGSPDALTPCEGDPMRSDANHNGICDRWESTANPVVSSSSSLSSGSTSAPASSASSSASSEPSSAPAASSSAASVSSSLPASSSQDAPSSAGEPSSLAAPSSMGSPSFSQPGTSNDSAFSTDTSASSGGASSSSSGGGPICEQTNIAGVAANPWYPVSAGTLAMVSVSATVAVMVPRDPNGNNGSVYLACNPNGTTCAPTTFSPPGTTGVPITAILANNNLSSVYAARGLALSACTSSVTGSCTRLTMATFNNEVGMRLASGSIVGLAAIPSQVAVTQLAVVVEEQQSGFLGIYTCTPTGTCALRRSFGGGALATDIAMHQGRPLVDLFFTDFPDGATGLTRLDFSTPDVMVPIADACGYPNRFIGNFAVDGNRLFVSSVDGQFNTTLRNCTLDANSDCLSYGRVDFTGNTAPLVGPFAVIGTRAYVVQAGGLFRYDLR